jgi:glycosyltransferase involved in cell wall biosynthesis
MQRVLIFSLAYFPHVGGAEIAIKEITDRIDDIEFHMLTLRFGNEPQEEQMGNIVVHRIGGGDSYISKILFIARAAYAARAMHRTLHFDMFWAMMSYMLFPIVLARFLGIKVPYLLTLQEGDPFSHTFNRAIILPFRPLLKVGFRSASGVTAISTYLAGWAERMGFLGDVSVIPNGVDLHRFIASDVDARHEGIELVTASRLVAKNGLDDVIRALVLLPQQVYFRVYGTGREEPRLRRLAEDLGVLDRVLFNGYVSHAQLPQKLKSADIFVRPSRSEGMGNAFIEAMAAGVPVVATQVGGIADFLFDAKRNPDTPPTGWAVDVNAPDQIAEAVKDIMTNPVKVEHVRENAFRLVQKNYDWSLIATKMQDALVHAALSK